MSLVLKLEIQDQGLQAALKTMDKMASSAAKGSAMRELGLLLQRNIVKHTPVKTGGAKGAVLLKGATASEARVVGAISYWPALNDGSAAHVIRPKSAKVLRFNVGSGVVFAREVKHPGTHGVHAFQDGLKDTEPMVVPVLKKHMGL